MRFRAAHAWCTASMMAALIGSVHLALDRAVASEPARGTVLPARCEQRVGGLYETRAQATIDKLGERYALTVRCNGVHQIYVRVPSPVDLEGFVGKSVRARYRYVDEPNPYTRCIKAPCPSATERLVDIRNLVELPCRTPEGKPPVK